MKDFTKNRDYFSKKVADSVSAILSYWDNDQVCRFVNHAFLDWFGKKSEDIIDKLTIKELLGPVYQISLPYLKKAYRGLVQEFEREIPSPVGEVRYTITTYTPVVENGEVIGIISHIADITYLKKMEMELKRAKEKAEESATHDFLTGLPNRVFLHDRIRNGISLAERNGTMIGVLLIDIDNFKAINDTFGHLSGDEVLKEIANRLKSAIRKYDTVFRVGGDEFLVLSIEIKKIDQIDILAKRLLKLARLPLIIKNMTIQPLFSIGIAVYPENTGTPDELINNADKALYKSKESGKNCYYFSNLTNA